MFLKKLRAFFLEVFFNHKEQPKISLLIPFSSKDPIRKRNLRWLLRYWRCQLPEAEIIIGRSNSNIFRKGEALNNAVKKSKGKVLVILDADAYLPGNVIERCADRILEEQLHNIPLWYVPYRHLYRLTKDTTEDLLRNDPCEMTAPNDEPFSYQIENTGDKAKYGHRYGAMIMMFPREAYKVLGCFDERFQGWGGEDVALLRALDTLYGKHKTTPDSIYHLWHPYIGGDYQTRMWKGQIFPEANSNLANKYHQATRKPSQMRDIMNDAFRYKVQKDHKNKFGNLD